MLHIENLHAHYGPIEALKNINLHIEAGEIITLIGANGAGKSTLLNTICGNPRASAGKIEYCGENLARVPTHKISQRGIALVPEGRRIFPALTIEENLELGGYHHSKAENKRGLEHIYQLFPRLLERRSQRAVSTGCRAISLLLCPRATKFCKKIDIPMAEMSGTKRGLLRNGL